MVIDECQRVMSTPKNKPGIATKYNCLYLKNLSFFETTPNIKIRRVANINI